MKPLILRLRTRVFRGHLPALRTRQSRRPDAWVRGTVPAQTVDRRLHHAQQHRGREARRGVTHARREDRPRSTSRCDGTACMHMHAPVDAVALPAGKRVELKPGGYHVMLMDLAQPLKAGDKVPLTFTIEDKGGKRTQRRGEGRRAAARRDEAAHAARAARPQARARNPGTVNLPVTRASTVTFESLAEMEEMQRRFDADELVPTYGIAQHAAARGVRGADGGDRGRPSRGDAALGPRRGGGGDPGVREGGRPRARHRQRLRPDAPLLHAHARALRRRDHVLRSARSARASRS